MSGHLSLGRPEGTGRQPHSQDPKVPVLGYSQCALEPWSSLMAWGLVATRQEFWLVTPLNI